MQNFESLKNTVISGDIRHVFSQIPDYFVQTIITSPPYFGHRKYSGEVSNILRTAEDDSGQMCHTRRRRCEA